MPSPTTSETDPLNARPIPLRVLLGRLMLLGWAHRWAAVPAFLATIVLQLATLVSLICQGLAIDVLRRQADASAPAPQWPFGLAPPEGFSFAQTILLLGGVILLASLLVGVARFAQRVADEHFVQVCIVDLRTRLYQKLQRLSFRFFDEHDTGQIIQRLTADSQSVRMFIQGVGIRLLIAGATFIVFAAFALREHVWLTLACLTVIPLQALVMARFGRLGKPAFLAQMRLIDTFVHHFQESIAGVRVIRSFGRETERVAQTDEKTAEARDHRIDLERLRSRHIPAVVGSGILSSAILLAFGGYLVVLGPANGGIALGTLWVFRGLMDRLGSQVEAFAMLFAAAPEALAGAERVFKLLDHPIDIADGKATLPPSGRLSGAVEFKDVTFGYDPALPILHDITFAAKPGENIAVVGPTGSGKSTLLGLISRFYDPDKGHVVFDGIDARDLPLKELRRSIGVVFQEPFLFSNTIRNNIALGHPDAAIEEVASAVEAASATEIIEEASDGYDTIVGERGVSLSGGQRQRFTIARALLLRPPILLLDDATGSVDALTESHIQRSLDDYTRNATTFIVAHRLSTLRQADRIFVLDQGRIVDIGTHDELLNREGHYRAAALIQLALSEHEQAQAQTQTQEGAA